MVQKIHEIYSDLIFLGRAVMWVALTILMIPVLVVSSDMRDHFREKGSSLQKEIENSIRKRKYRKEQ